MNESIYVILALVALLSFLGGMVRFIGYFAVGLMIILFISYIQEGSFEPVEKFFKLLAENVEKYAKKLLKIVEKELK